MNFLSSIFFGVIVNIDNFTVGLAYGIKKIKIGYLANFIIGIITSLFTLSSMLFGFFINQFIPLKVSRILGSLILVFMGIYFIIDFINKKLNKRKSLINIKLLDFPETADIDKSGHIDYKESIFLAFALSLNNLGLGIGSSMSGTNIFLASLFTLLFSMPLIILGHKLGNKLISTFFNNYDSLISGLIILILGLISINLA